MKHFPQYTKHLLGYEPITHRKVHGYSVVCSCGWELKTNENAPAHGALEERWKAEKSITP